MKKAVCMLLVFVLMCPFAFAELEDFTIRNGISFGDTISEVREKETLTIKEADDEFPFTLTTVEGTVAGIEDSEIEYSFDEEKKLNEVVYNFDTVYSRESADANYAAITDGLIRKYGSPLDGSFAIVGSIVESIAFQVAFTQLMGDRADLINSEEWVVDFGDYYVKIDHMNYYYTYSGEMYYRQALCYKYFTDEDLTEVSNEIAEERAAVDSDL